MRLEKAFLMVMTALILLGAPMFVMIPAGGENLPADEPLDFTEVNTNYVVTSGQIKSINNEQWIMNANIEVQAGGTLYINGTHIKWGGTTDGQYGLYVRAGGVLFMDYDCNLTADDTSTLVEIVGGTPWTRTWGIHWKFEIYGDARVENSELSYIWGANGNYLQDARGGIQCQSDNILIQNVTISNVEQCGIYTGDVSGSSTSGFDPVVNNVQIYNTTGWGIFAAGSASNPTITNVTIIGSSYRGVQYFYGASGRFDWVTIKKCADIGMTLDPVTSGSMVINYGDFSYNLYGYSARRAGSVTLNNCNLDNNMMYGLEMAHDSGYSQTVTINGGTAKNNGLDGIGASNDQCSIAINNMEIAYNFRNGVTIPTYSTVDVTLSGCKIYNNGEYGIYDYGGGGTVSNSVIYDNTMGNVFIEGGSDISISQSTINSTTANNIMVTDQSSPTITLNIISRGDIGLMVEQGSSALVGNNMFSENRLGAWIQEDRLTLDSNNFTNNGETGLYLEKANQLKLRRGIFDNNPVGILIQGGDYSDLKNVTFRSASTAAIHCIEGANITLMEAKMQANTLDFKLEDGSIARAYEINIPSSQVQIMDPDSEFWQYWKLSVIVADNVTFDPIEAANVIVRGSNLDIITSGSTVFDGSFIGYVPVLKMLGETVIFDYNPINVTVDKDGYVPYWGGDETMDANIDRTVLLSENRAPQLPQDHEPAETHQKRPTIMWGDAYDWNGDIVNYMVNVYMDELYTGDQIVEDVIVRPSEYTFTKNLRYNRVYWVEIEAFDPWGLSDSIIFSFETTNTAPTTPNIGFLSTPVSTRDDITVVILNASTDIDIDPIDDISYLVEWYAFKENSWVLLASGLNLMTLSSEKTSEGEDIKVVVKPYDGIEYGIASILTTPVVNFVPEVISVPIEITMNEDEVGMNLVDLKTLFLDRDGDDISFRIKTERHVLAVIDQVTNNVTFYPDPNWVGEDYIIIEAFDTKVHEEAWPTIRINITVEPVNDPPMINFVNEKSVGQGETVLIQGIQGSTQIISVEAYDEDEIYGDSWTFSTNFLDVVGEGVIPEGDFQFEENTGRLSVFLSNDLVGEILFNITATDQSGASSTVQIRLIVDNTNDVMTDPKITSPEDGANINQDIGGRIQFDAQECYDPDFDIPNSNERLTYEWYFSDGEEITNAGTNVEHRFGVTGNYTIRLLVRDTFGAEKETSIKIFVNVLEEEHPLASTTDEGNPTLVALIIILVVIGIIFLAVLLFFVFRKDPLADTAEAEEQAHEALVARQQQDALEAQERLQALLSGAAYEGVSGPALPSAEGPDLEALPAAPTEEYPGQEPPMEAYPEQPQYETPPMSEPPMEQPPLEPTPEPIPEPTPEPAPEPVQAPMQAAPAGTVPMPEQPPTQGNLPAPEEQQQ